MVHPFLLDGPSGPLAVDVLRDWLEKQGFKPMQVEVRGEGYFTRGTGSCAERWVSDLYERATIGYRGYAHKAKLRAVAAYLDRLGVKYGVEKNDFDFPFLVVELSALTEPRGRVEVPAETAS